ncbi:MAG: TolC family protein [Planctomycetaceae bacterium]|jgi:outer membrane protein TolC|nr:TolC family protein [Planctomycetaceae bacterium]
MSSDFGSERWFSPFFSLFMPECSGIKLHFDAYLAVACILSKRIIGYKEENMSFLNKISVVLLLGMFAFLINLVGCHPQQPFYLTEKGQYQKYMKTHATRIDYPDAEVPKLNEVCGAIDPLTLANPDPSSFWDISLEESIQIALQNCKVVRTLNGVGFSSAGTSGAPGALLSSPNAVGTVYDIAMTESNPQYGVEAALSAFDATLAATTQWGKSDVPGSPQTDNGTFGVGINQTAPTGTRYYLNQSNQYQFATGGFANGWSSYIEGGVVQPLLRGNGIQFNRIAGTSGQPGVYNGVAIARINTDQAINDFEMATRNLVADVEKAYWNLYYAYHRLESVKSGRDGAQQTWSQIWAKKVAGAKEGTAQNEAQSRNNYYAFRGQTEAAQTNLFRTEAALRSILGLAVTDGRLIRPSNEPITAPIKLDWQSIITEALYRSPELRKQKWEVKKRELELIAAKNFLLPQVDLSAGYRWNGAGDELINQGHYQSNAIGSLTSGNYSGWTVGVTASMPFGWRRELAGVRNAQLGLAKSRAVLQDQELELTHQLADSFREIAQAYQTSVTMLQRRIAAGDEVSAVTAAFEISATTLDQVLNAQTRLSEAETEYYRAVIDYNIAIMTLHYRKGSLLEYDNVYLVEGSWPSKAYFDAKRRAKAEDASTRINYGFTRPKVVSRHRYQQFQYSNNAISNGVTTEVNTTITEPTQQHDEKLLERPPVIKPKVIESENGTTPIPTPTPIATPDVTTNGLQISPSTEKEFRQIPQPNTASTTNSFAIRPVPIPTPNNTNTKQVSFTTPTSLTAVPKNDETTLLNNRYLK